MFMYMWKTVSRRKFYTFKSVLYRLVVNESSLYVQGGADQRKISNIFNGFFFLFYAHVRKPNEPTILVVDFMTTTQPLMYYSSLRSTYTWMRKLLKTLRTGIWEYISVYIETTCNESIP